jgi:hypothetical protein
VLLVEANLFSRLVRVVKAYVSNFTEQFEDPEVMLDRVTDEMQEDLIKMRQATAKVRDVMRCDVATIHFRVLCCCMMHDAAGVGWSAAACIPLLQLCCMVPASRAWRLVRMR